MPKPGAHTPQEALNMFMGMRDENVIHESAADALEKAAQIVEDEAKRVIGTYEYGWPPLAPATLAQKQADTPLYETGEMRDSIEHYVDRDRLYGEVGSNNPKAVWQELGTFTAAGSQHIPPRSFLMGAAMHKEDEIHRLTGVTIYTTMVGYMEQRAGYYERRGTPDPLGWTGPQLENPSAEPTDG